MAILRVRDLLDDAKDILGTCDQATVFARLTDAIEVLANKGQWDPLLAYLSTNVTDNVLVTLPEQVEVPLRINIDGHPAFARDRLFEFTLNGPGSGPLVSWTWADFGDDGAGNRRIKLSSPAT